MPLSNINFTNIPAPAVVQPLDYPTILNTMKADLVLRMPSLAATIDLESEPVLKLLEVCAYRELLLRQRVNDGAKGVMLAYAVGSDLDQIGANFGVGRFVIRAADNTVTPPITAMLEADTVFRDRIRLSFYSRTTAGSVNQYKYYALSSNPAVQDVSVTSPKPGDVLLTVLSNVGNGVPTQAIMDTVFNTCNADNIRPLTDIVRVQAAIIVSYTVDIALTIYPQGDAIGIQAASLKSVTAYCALHHRLGHDITRSGLMAVASVEGVQNVTMPTPITDLVVDNVHASHASRITINVTGAAV